MTDFPLINHPDEVASTIERMLRAKGLQRTNFHKWPHERRRRGVALFAVSKKPEGFYGPSIAADLESGIVRYYDDVLVHEEFNPTRAAAFVSWVIARFPDKRDKERFSDVIGALSPPSLKRLLEQ